MSPGLQRGDIRTGVFIRFPLLVRIRKPAGQPGGPLGWHSHPSLMLAEPWRRAPWSRGRAKLGGRAAVSLGDQGRRVPCPAGVSTGGCRAKRNPGCQARHRPADRQQHCALCLVHPSLARRGGRGGCGGWVGKGWWVNGAVIAGVLGPSQSSFLSHAKEG